MIDPVFAAAALEKFVGCDSDESNAGTAEMPSVWLFGIEHGAVGNIVQESQLPANEYSVGQQLTYTYNRKAFKLLAAIEGRNVADYRDFAEEKQPFVRGVPGYFKGNLYPFACSNVNNWPEDAARETGTTDKREYQDWCRMSRLPTLHTWVNEYQPRLFIGVGVTCRDEFSQAVFGARCAFTDHAFNVNGHRKRAFSRTEQGRTLAVVPHFSGANGLNSDESIQIVGRLIADLKLA